MISVIKIKIKYFGQTINMCESRNWKFPLTLMLKGAISMTIYCTTTNYRKIYENHIGVIPKEPNGRTYEIHHLDGNHSNNDPLNLKAVTLQEHYDIHYAQGDWGACMLMKLQRMDHSPDEIVELNRNQNDQIIIFYKKYTKSMDLVDFIL